MLVIEQVEAICPICGKPLLLFKGGRLYKLRCRKEKCLTGTVESSVENARISFLKAYKKRQEKNNWKVELFDKYAYLIFLAVAALAIALGDILGIFIFGMNLHEEVFILLIPLLVCLAIYLATHTNRTLLEYASLKSLKRFDHVEENEMTDLNDVTLCLEYAENKLVYHWYGHYEYPTFDDRVQPLAESLTLAINLNSWLSQRISANVDVSRAYSYANILVEHIALIKKTPTRLSQEELDEFNEELHNVVNELKALRLHSKTYGNLLAVI